jgi:hypothetical protein
MPEPNLSPSVPAVEGTGLRSRSAYNADPDAYIDPKTAATIIHQGNSAMMHEYANAARGFANSVRAEAEKYSLDGLTWEGTGADAARRAVSAHKAWLVQMASRYEDAAAEAEKLARAHDAAASSHPTVEEVQSAEDEVNAALAAQPPDPERTRVAVFTYSELVKESEEVRDRYRNAVSDVRATEPEKPPAGVTPVMPITGNGAPRQTDGRQPTAPGPPGNGGGGQPPAGDPAAMPPGTGQPAAQPQSGAPADRGAPSGGGAPSGAGPPSGGGAPGGLPGGGPSTGTPKLPTDPSLKPAAAASGGGGSGGGGSGGGGAGGGSGAPSMPLSPAVGAETVAPTPAGAARGGVAPAPTAGGAMGGMGGMAPMGHGAGHNQGTEKRRDPNLAPDEDLYIEDRPWTEAVIGNRRRRDVQDGKEST